MNIKAIAFDAYGTLFDVHSVTEKCEAIFPNKGREISEIWRAKQLKYTWLRSLMGCYKNFWEITKDALIYTLKKLELDWDEQIVADILHEYLHLTPYDEIEESLKKLKETVDLSILSNGSPQMLHKMVSNANMSELFAEIISVDELQIFKPAMDVYKLGPTKFNLQKEEMLFISSNPFDVAGAKVFGYHVCWINRFNLQLEQFTDLKAKPDLIITSLAELVGKLSTFKK